MHGGHEEATGSEMIMCKGQISHHQVALRIGEQEDQVIQTVRLAFDAVPCGSELYGTRFPGLLAGESPGEVLQRRMLLRAQKEHTAFRADVRVYIKGINEGVESVGHGEKIISE